MPKASNIYIYVCTQAPFEEPPFEELSEAIFALIKERSVSVDPHAFWL